MVLSSDMSDSLRTTPVWRHAMVGVLEAVSDFPRWLKLSHEITPGTQVSADFFGINVATNDDPSCDDYIITSLSDLGLQQVRLSFSYDSVGAPAERLLKRLLEAGYDVLLDLLPSPEDARRMDQDSSAQARWEAFVTQVIDQYGKRLAALEIGNTPNRGRWSGHDAQGYLTTWKIAATVATKSQVALAGPNISDFEPIYNVGFLRGMLTEHSSPTIQTDNLFVERVVQPEAHDHRVAGRYATNFLKLNLVKKARILVEIGKAQGITQTWCTYTCWTRKRLSRWNIEPEQKNAHYIMRYLIIAAASGSLDRVYWGPLICQRDGLIACGDDNYPKVDNVSYYRSVRGKVNDFQKTAAYDAFRFSVAMLKGATCTAAFSEIAGLHHYTFDSPTQGTWHVVWCMDRNRLALEDLYSNELLEAAKLQTPTGEQLEHMPQSITEQPLILRWEQPVAPRSTAQMKQIGAQALSNVTHWPRREWNTHILASVGWRGAYLIADPATLEAPDAEQIPALLTQLPETKVLRDKRNRLWNIHANWWSAGEQTVKLNRAKGLKRLSYRFLPSKGKRHWNNATELLRLGINTPQPLGFFEQPSSNAHDSYYICQYVEDAFSCRNLFTAFAAGDTEYQGISKSSWLQQVAEFIARMHRFGVIHRDLSSGNLMMTCKQGEVTFFLIDIGRATIDQSKSGPARMRFKDLNRICYKLSWPDREALIDAYASYSNHHLPKWWRLSLSSYDWKQNSKKFLKGTKKPAKPKSA